MAERVAVVVLGVSGAGKTTVARAVADRLGWPFAEADEFHPAANVEKMRAGHPLDDSDRRPWLEALHAYVVAEAAAGRSVVMTCSCLKRAYRETLTAGLPAVFFVQLEVPRAVLEERLRNRVGHYMPASLLGSQLDTLEPLGPDEPGIIVRADHPPAEVIETVLAKLEKALRN
jgi:gluconokinase